MRAKQKKVKQGKMDSEVGWSFGDGGSTSEGKKDVKS